MTVLKKKCFAILLSNFLLTEVNLNIPEVCKNVISTVSVGKSARLLIQKIGGYESYFKHDIALSCKTCLVYKLRASCVLVKYCILPVHIYILSHEVL